MASNGQRHFEDVELGMELPRVVKGPLTTTHLVKWAAANGNYARIHWDYLYATRAQGHPNVVVNGSLKDQYLGQLLLDFAGEEGWMWRCSVRHRGMDFPGDVLTASGRVVGKEDKGGHGVVECEIGLRNSRGQQTAHGSGTLLLPKRGHRLPLVWEVG